jgi:hypothetical protein
MMHSSTSASHRAAFAGRRLAVLVIAVAAALAFSAPAFAAPRQPILSPTQATFVIPSGSTSTWTLRLWTHGNLQGSETGTSGTLMVPVPATTDCTFQADVSVVPLGGTSSYFSGRRATVPGCGPLPTIAGDIYLCPPAGASTTEVTGGTLAAVGPQTLVAQPNPMAPTPVLAGTYTMTAGNPSGYMFVPCGGSAIVAPGGASATESVPVFIGDTGGPEMAPTVTGGGGVAIFYVTTATAPAGTGAGASDPTATALTKAQTSPGPAFAAGGVSHSSVTAPLTATPVAGTSLAFTGMNTGPLLLIGFLSLILGTLLTTAARVRRRLMSSRRDL